MRVRAGPCGTCLVGMRRAAYLYGRVLWVLVLEMTPTEEPRSLGQSA